MEDFVEHYHDVKFPTQPEWNLAIHQFQSAYACGPPCSHSNRKRLRILGGAPVIRSSQEIITFDDLPGGRRLQLPDKKFTALIIEDDGESQAAQAGPYLITQFGF